MIAGVIVAGSLLFATAFLVAWWFSPGLRAWIEEPKHRFQANLRQYDRAWAGERPADEIRRHV
jgi:hypothetical protein